MNFYEKGFVFAFSGLVIDGPVLRYLVRQSELTVFFVACTFLGPSRKRGPPKGYIDAIEARLHQTEALLGIMISSADERAQSLLKDISQVLT